MKNSHTGSAQQPDFMISTAFWAFVGWIAAQERAVRDTQARIERMHDRF